MAKKILFFQGLGAIAVMRASYARVFHNIGWDVRFYNPESKNILDVLNEFEPDSIFLGSYEIDRATFKGLTNRPNLDIILWAPNHGPLNKDIDPQDGVLCISEQEKVYINELIKINDIRHIYTYYHQNCLQDTHSYYKRDFGLTPVGILLAADLIIHGLGEKRPEFITDVSFIGGNWQEKGKNLNRFLYPLCMRDDMKVRIYGHGWAVPNCVGGISDDNIKHVHASSLVCPNILEPHSIKYGFDYNERAAKVLSAGGFCISQATLTAKRDIFLNDEVIFINEPHELLEAIQHFQKYPDKRDAYIQRGIKYAYTEGNYFKKTRDLLETRGDIESIIKLENILSQIKVGMKLV